MSAADAGDPPPYYARHVFVCTNERPAGHPRGCCLAKGSVELRTYIKERAKAMGLAGVRINAAGCLDRCERGPTMVVYPEGVWYTVTTKADADEILETHIRDGGRVSRLILRPEDS